VLRIDDDKKKERELRQTFDSFKRKQNKKKFGGFKFIRPIDMGATAYVFEVEKDGERFAYRVAIRHQDNAIFKKQCACYAKLDLNSPGIPALYDTVEGAQVFQLIPKSWKPLSEIIHPKGRKGGIGKRLPLLTATDILHQILKCLDNTHSRGIYHSDLKSKHVHVKPDYSDILIADWMHAYYVEELLKIIGRPEFNRKYYRLVQFGYVGFGEQIPKLIRRGEFKPDHPFIDFMGAGDIGYEMVNGEEPDTYPEITRDTIMPGDTCTDFQLHKYAGLVRRLRQDPSSLERLLNTEPHPVHGDRDIVYQSAKQPMECCVDIRGGAFPEYDKLENKLLKSMTDQTNWKYSVHVQISKIERLFKQINNHLGKKGIPEFEQRVNALYAKFERDIVYEGGNRIAKWLEKEGISLESGTQPKDTYWGYLGQCEKMKDKRLFEAIARCMVTIDGEQHTYFEGDDINERLGKIMYKADGTFKNSKKTKWVRA